MITICTNDETNRPTLVQALIDDGCPLDKPDTHCEQMEDGIWGEVIERYFENIQPDNRHVSAWFGDWNGGKFKQSGYRSGIVHSDTSQREADEAAELIAGILAKVAIWQF